MRFKNKHVRTMTMLMSANVAVWGIVGAVGLTIVDGGLISTFAGKKQPSEPPSTPVSLDGRKRDTIQAGAQFHCVWSDVDDATRQAVFTKMAQANIDSVRIDIGWSSIEPAKGQYDAWHVGNADRCVDMAHQAGLKVLLMAHRAPSWASGSQDNAVPPKNAADYGDFMGWAAQRYGTKVHAYQVWNEPNPSQQFFKGTPAQYADLLKAAHPAIKAANPEALVVFGGPSTNDAEWVREVYQAGAKDYFDIMSTHPYQGMADQAPDYRPDDQRWWFANFPAVVDVMREFGDESKDVWFTEFGYSTHATHKRAQNYERGVTQAQQAEYLVQAFEYAEKNYPTVKSLFVYNIRDRNDSSEHENNYGILNRDLSPKQAYGFLRDYLAR